jgi:hypothetical protein
MENVLQRIAESEILLVDVTDRNPNVFYELGIAHMLKEVNNILLISQSSSADSIPFDVAAMRYLVYEPTDSGMREIGKKLIQAVCSVSDRVHRIVVPNNGKGELAYRLMGEDDYLYSFAISQCHIAYNGAEFRLQVTRHAALEQPRVVFDRGLGLSVGNKIHVPEAGWYLTLAKCTDASAMFVIDETAEPDSAIKSSRKP